MIPSWSKRRPAPARGRGARRCRGAIAWAIAAAAGAVIGCEPTATGSQRLVYRLVDPALREGATVLPPGLLVRDARSQPAQLSDLARVPSATIADDTRYVLAGHESALLTDSKRLSPRDPELPSLRLGLGPRLPGASRLMLVPLVKPPRGQWQVLPAIPAQVEGDGLQRAVRLRLPAALPPGDPLVLTVRALRAPEASETSYTTPRLEIPRGATLEFAYGVLGAATRQGPVRFAIEACRDARCEILFDETFDPGRQADRGWQERQLPLTGLEGSRSLRFLTEQVGPESFTLPVWADPVIIAPEPGRTPPPNLVLLSIDTLRRDHLDLYGYPRETAPFLQQLAAGGVVFENLIAEAGTTDPSHMTMFTSLPALVHGVQCCMKRLAVPVVTLAQVLREHGYRTAAFTENGPLAHERGFSIGFDRYVENKSELLLAPKGQVARTFSQARRWLERNRERRFFLFLHTFQVHAPYAPPESYRRYFTQGESAARPGELPALVAQYDREIRYVDDLLAALHGWMEAEGLNADTIWIVLSDHGEEFDEHGSVGHATLPYETVLRVPLIARGPGILGGIRDATPLRHLDLMPTLLDLMGLPAPPQVKGRSLAHRFRSADPGALPDAASPPRFSATWVLPKGHETPALSVQEGPMKLIRHRRDGQERLELYDLSRDPGEGTDLLRHRPEEAERLGALLDDHQQTADAWRTELLGELEPGTPEPAAVPLDPARDQMLRALGYIE